MNTCYSKEFKLPQKACDKCTLGVMDNLNPHLWNECLCECHSFNGDVACNKQWFCFHCSWVAMIETWSTKIGMRYLCRSCGSSGLLSEYDSPKFLNSDEQKNDESDFDFIKRIYNTNV